jgi:hypothetical protein
VAGPYGATLTGMSTAVMDPVLAAIEAAPLDELPETEAEKAAIAEANGLTRPHADVVQALEATAAE